MRKIIIFLLSVLFLLFFMGNKTWGVGTSCKCKIGTTKEGFPACVDTSPPGCPSGETCRCNPIIDSFSGMVVDCEPGTCALKPTPTPGIACDICGCEEDKIEPSDACLKCNTECKKCILPAEKGGKYPNGGSWSALGCINTGTPQEFIVWLLKSVIGIAGGIAFLLMLWGGFQIITSTGDPEKLNKGKEILTSAIIGLVVIVFSLFLLQLIGVKILQIPGFGTP